ncbi:MAG: type II toxin-antitoxin system VapC family toxin [Stellaceae bacterium]
MFLDASAMIAIIVREADANALESRLGQAAKVYTSPIAVYETVLGLARIGHISVGAANAMLDEFLQEVRVLVVPISADIGRSALAAFERYGKGRHQAALNMGDCFAYACARSIDVPLLCKGDDFPRTDLALG